MTIVAAGLVRPQDGELRLERPGRPYTLAEVDAASDEGSEWWEADAGVVVVNAPPSFAHQRMVTGLIVGWRAVLTPDQWLVLTAPQRVVVDDTTWAEPDVAIWATGQAEVGGLPALVAEVNSPSTSRRDLQVKPGLYARAGVEWLVLADPDALTVVTYALASDGSVDPLGQAAGNETVACPLTGVALVPARLALG
ncbi:MAG: Uma2 family endonuclease [Acidimicrobiales bacterium]